MRTEINNPKQISNIVDMCDNHAAVEFYDERDQSWKQGTLVGIRRFAGDFMFLVYSAKGIEQYTTKISLNEQISTSSVRPTAISNLRIAIAYGINGYFPVLIADYEKLGRQTDIVETRIDRYELKEDAINAGRCWAETSNCLFEEIIINTGGIYDYPTIRLTRLEK
jgi:Ni,Fe-hydrogenase III large subunit